MLAPHQLEGLKQRLSDEPEQLEELQLLAYLQISQAEICIQATLPRAF